MAVKKKEKGNGASYFFDALFSLALLAGVSYGGYYLITHGNVVEQKETYVQNVTEEITEEATEPEMVYDIKEVSEQDMHQGNLILVNRDLEFQGGEEDLVSLYEVTLEKDCHSFGAKDGDLKVQKMCAEALVEMFNAFYDETFDNNIVVQQGYRTRERQQELYDSESTDIPAGFSEHHTGLSVNLTLSEDSYDGTGIYSWINEHCAEYGFILRYPENKASVTKIDYEPEHYRYIGKPHAQYITQNGLCLEEYIMLLHGYDYESQHLMITDENSLKVYEVYYCQADGAAEKTLLPVPTDKEYTISGNNQDGFIVTVDTGELAVPEELAENQEDLPETADEP